LFGVSDAGDRHERLFVTAEHEEPLPFHTRWALHAEQRAPASRG
jgi:hypothetical protein